MDKKEKWLFFNCKASYFNSVECIVIIDLDKKYNLKEKKKKEKKFAKTTFQISPP